MTLEDMDCCVAAIRAEHPRATLTRNMVGNLAIIDEKGQFVGWIEVSEGKLYWDRDVP